MTASGSGVPGRETTTDDASRRGIGRQILAVVAIGLVFRLIMAYGIEGLRGSGFDADLGLFRYWATTLAQYGPPGFYANASYADYTPGYLYALWPVGIVGQWLGGVGDLIKLPAIITDVVLGLVVYRLARDLGVTERRATLAGAVVIVNPITWFDSVVWGQVDSFGTVFLLLAIRELWKDRTERAAILSVVAALVKPQLAILVPIIAVVTIRRALWPSGGYGDEASPPRSGFAWERRLAGPIRILTTGVAGFVTAVVVAAPFGLSVISVSGAAPFVDSSLLRLVLSTAAQYPYVTVNAYNLWALFPVNGLSTANNGGGYWIPDAPVTDGSAWAAIGSLPAGLVGAALLLGIAAVVAFLVARHPDRLTILVGVCVLALAFFAVPTRVHERYLFPLFGLAAVLFAFSWRWRIAYVAAAVATFLNMYVVLTTLYPGNPGIADWFGIGDAIRSFPGVTLVAVLHTAVFAWAVVQLRSGARRTLAAELGQGRLPEEAERRHCRRARCRRRTAGGPAAGAATAGGPAAVAATAGGPGPLGRDRVRRAGGGVHGHAVEWPRPGRATPAPDAGAGVVRPAVMERARARGVVPGPRAGDAHPSRPLGRPGGGGSGPARPPGPVAPDRARGRCHVPAHVPPRRARAHALRRGLPRAHRRRVPPGLALRHRPRHLRVDAPASCEVRDGGRHRPVRRPRRRGQQQPGQARARCRDRAPASGSRVDGRA